MPPAKRPKKPQFSTRNMTRVHTPVGNRVYVLLDDGAELEFTAHEDGTVEVMLNGRRRLLVRPNASNVILIDTGKK